MSEKLISSQATLELFENAFAYAFIAWLVVLFIGAIIYIIYSKKKSEVSKANIEDSKLIQQKYEELENIRKDIGEKEYQKRIKRLDKKTAKQRTRNASKLDLANKKVKKVGNSIKVVHTAVFLCGLGILLIISFTNFHVGGTVGKIHKVDYVDNELVVTAFYEIKYEDIQKATITAFVKNNTDHGIQNAKIKIKNADITADVFAIEPGEEKIVSFVVYPVKNKNYEFEIIVPEEEK